MVLGDFFRYVFSPFFKQLSVITFYINIRASRAMCSPVCGPYLRRLTRFIESFTQERTVHSFDITCPPLEIVLRFPGMEYSLLYTREQNPRSSSTYNILYSTRKQYICKRLRCWSTKNFESGKVGESEHRGFSSRRAETGQFRSNISPANRRYMVPDLPGPVAGLW